MWLVQIDGQPIRSGAEISGHGAARELLKEVLDQVLLREPLDHLDLLHCDRNLVRDRSSELELRRSFRHERTQQLAAGHERYGDACATAAAPELAAESAQTELFGRLRSLRRRPAQEEALTVLLRQVEVDGRSAEEVERAADDKR